MNGLPPDHGGYKPHPAEVKKPGISADTKAAAEKLGVWLGFFLFGWFLIIACTVGTVHIFRWLF